jgi:hypothetical protein
VEPIYGGSNPTDRLRQGEVLTKLQRGVLVLQAEPVVVNLQVFDYAVLVTQDCDLEQDYDARGTGDQKHRLLAEAILVEAMPALELRELAKRTLGVNKDLWARVVRNKDERFHVIESIPNSIDALGEGLPDLALDFRRCFSIRMDELLYRIAKGPTRRRAWLRTPWAEQLSSRLAYFYARVGLPREHSVSASLAKPANSVGAPPPVPPFDGTPEVQ